MAHVVIATAVAVLTYAWVTRTITEWRNALREKMNRLDGQALARSVDSLLNYETVKYFGAEAREQARYASAARAYARALAAQGAQPAVLPATDCTLAGLAAARPKVTA